MLNADHPKSNFTTAIEQAVKCPSCKQPGLKRIPNLGPMRAMAWQCDCGWQGFTPQETTHV